MAFLYSSLCMIFKNMIKISRVRKLLSKTSSVVTVKSISNLWVKIVEDNINQ